MNITATASDPDGDPITYTWTATAGSVQGTGGQVRWTFTNVSPGNYMVTVRVDDGRGGNATCSVDIRVDPRPNRPPTVSFSSDRNTVLVGERVRFTATATDPDGDSLTYTWSANGGQIVGTGTCVELDTTGVPPGSYTATLRVEDGRGGASDASASIQVNAPPPQPQAIRINDCTFNQNNARVDNVCKRILDDVALRLQNEPQATLVIVGYADPGERMPQQLSDNRAMNVVNYLDDERGIDRSRVSTRTGAGQPGAGAMNRRTDIVWVPEGATF